MRDIKTVVYYAHLFCISLYCRLKSSVDGIVAHSLHNWLSFDQVHVTGQSINVNICVRNEKLV